MSDNKNNTNNINEIFEETVDAWDSGNEEVPNADKKSPQKNLIIEDINDDIEEEGETNEIDGIENKSKEFIEQKKVTRKRKQQKKREQKISKNENVEIKENKENKENKEKKEKKENKGTSKIINEIVTINNIKYIKENGLNMFSINDEENNEIILQLEMNKSKNNLIIRKVNTKNSVTYKRCTYINCERKKRRDHCYFHTDTHEGKVCIQLSDLHQMCFDERCKGNNPACVIGNKKHIFPISSIKCEFNNPEEKKFCKNYEDQLRFCLFHSCPNKACEQAGITTEMVASGNLICLPTECIPKGNFPEPKKYIEKKNKQDELKEENENENEDEPNNLTKEEVNELAEKCKKKISKYDKLSDKHEKEYNDDFEMVTKIKKQMVRLEHNRNKINQNIDLLTKKMCKSITKSTKELETISSSNPNSDDMSSVLDEILEIIVSFKKNEIGKISSVDINKELKKYNIELQKLDTVMTEDMRKKDECIRKREEYSMKLQEINTI